MTDLFDNINVPVKSAFTIPYRLKTREEVEGSAKLLQSIGLRHEYANLVKYAGKIDIEQPDIMKHVKKHVAMEFREHEPRKDEVAVVHSEKVHEVVDGLQHVGDFSLIEQKLPGIKVMAIYDTLYRFVMDLGPDLRTAIGMPVYPATLGAQAAAYHAIRQFLRKELKAWATTRRGIEMEREQLISLLMAYSLFDGQNEDILKALTMSLQEPQNPVLFQNACVELLFTRLAREVRLLTQGQQMPVRRSLSEKIARLDLAPKFRIALFQIYPSHLPHKDIPAVLDRMSVAAEKMHGFPKEALAKLQDTLSQFKHLLARTDGLYKEFFLSRELIAMKKHYKPVQVLKAKEVYSETVIKEQTKKVTMDFYPTKDYGDLLRFAVSEDCTGFKTGSRQLLHKEFFNIRIFRNKEWVGNIYTLDAVKKNGVILVDRIQIPRKINANYLNFFSTLREVFREMLQDVPYTEVLLPLTISNHDVVQNQWYAFHKKLAKRNITIGISSLTDFESLVGTRYYVLLEKEEKAELKKVGRGKS